MHDNNFRTIRFRPSRVARPPVRPSTRPSHAFSLPYHHNTAYKAPHPLSRLQFRRVHKRAAAIVVVVAVTDVFVCLQFVRRAIRQKDEAAAGELEPLRPARSIYHC